MNSASAKAALLEVCVDSVESALVAVEGGADRIEFCARLDVGGITPNFRELERVLSQVAVPVFAMVRPRAGDFVYDAAERNRMSLDMRQVLALGAHGVVLGLLTTRNEVDGAALSPLLEFAQDTPVTFHRAFDDVKDPHAALETLMEHGVTRLLTTGGPATAWQGRLALRALIAQAGSRLVVMPGGGVRQDHVLQLIESTGAREVHSSQVLRLDRSSN